MKDKQKKESIDLQIKPIELSDDVNDIKAGPVINSSTKLGIKSREFEQTRKTAEEHHRRNLLMQDPLLSSREFMQQMQKIRDAKVAEAAEAALLFDVKKQQKLQEIKQEARAKEQQRRLASESPHDREKRLELEAEKVTLRQKAINAISNRFGREHERLEVFFNMSDRKYADIEHTLDDSPVKRIINARPFGKVFNKEKYAYRCYCDSCRYRNDNPEQLNFTTVENRIRKTPEVHHPFLTKLLDSECQKEIQELKAQHAAEDNPDERIKILNRKIADVERMPVRNANDYAGFRKQDSNNLKVKQGLMDPFDLEEENQKANQEDNRRKYRSLY